MRKVLLPILVFILTLSVQESYASHLMGGDLTYECLGSGQYQLTLKVYRDCRGVDAGSTAIVSYNSQQCGVTSSVSLKLVSGFPRDITPTCPGQSSICGGGNLPYGVQEYVFQGVVTLPPGCGSDWKFGWSNCCRNNAINTLSSPGSNDMYVSTTIDNTLSPCNSSPIFSLPPVPFTCVNQPVNFNPGGTDLDGDSLAFSFAIPQQSAGTNVTYKSPYDINNPLSTAGGITINPANGDVSFTPNQTQVAVIAVQISEYRNGQLISTIVRDIQYTIINCSNQNPTISGINGGSNNSITIYAGENVCFDVNTDDADAGDAVSLDWNQSIPNATFTTTTANHPTGTFCWQTTQNDTGTHIFTVAAEDNNCPITGQATRSFTIIVMPCPKPPTNAGPDLVLCPNESATLNGSTTAPPNEIQSYTWSDGVNTHNGQTWTVNPAQTTVYTFSVTYTDGCIKTDQVLVRRSSTPTVSVFPTNATLCAGASIQLTATTNSAVRVQWFPSAGLSCDTCKVTVASPSSSTNYKVVAYNADNCPSDSATVNIISSPPPPPQSCQVIYATPTGTGSGSMSSPTNLAGAIAKAQCNNAIIKLATGTYTIDNPITNITSYTTIEGGHDPTTWAKSSTPGATTIYRSALNMEGTTDAEKRIVAIYMNSQAYFRFQDITFETANCPALASGDSSGYSNYVFHITNCSNYDFVRCQILSGKATGGRGGNTFPGSGMAGTGGTGGNGGAGIGTGCDKNGSPGTAGTAGSNNPGSSGAAGAGAIGDGCNIFGCGASGVNGRDGGNGGAGGPGIDGPATNPSAPVNTQFFQVGGKGIDGTDGLAGGGGGGGGGGSLGTDCTCNISGIPNGGKGGNGGNGGLRGTAGWGGGGSFCVYLFNNGGGGKFTDCNISSGAHGLGGQGGLGQAGSSGTAGTAGVQSTGSCSPKARGGNGGTGGNGGRGGNGQPGADGVNAGIVSNGVVPSVTNGSTAIAINTGVNSPTGFNLSAQPVITVSNTNCTFRNIDFSSSSSGAWDFGTGATPPSGNGANVNTQYTVFGRKDITFSGNQYTGFTIIPIDADSYIPEITTSATQLGTSDTFALCQGALADFYGVIPGADSFFWDFGGALSVNTFAGPQYDEVLNQQFNTVGVFKVKLRISTSCCGYSPYDSIYVLVEPMPQLAFNGYLGYCPGDSAVITAIGANRYEWSPPNYLSSTTSATVVAKPPTNYSYFLTGYSQTGLCVADTFFEIVVKSPPTLTFATTPAICGPSGSIAAIPNQAGNYTYTWQTPITDTDSLVTGLGVGGYNVTVTDNATGCTSTGNGIISAAGGLMGYIDSLTPTLCNGTCDGTIRVVAIGGSGNYNYQWSNGKNTRGITGLCVGSYSVTITDLNNNCTATANGDIAEPLALAPALLDTTGTTCPASCDGAATVDASGGTGSIAIIWDLPGNPIGNTQDNLCGGNNKVYFIDANGCNDSIEFIIPSSASLVVIDSVITNTSCYGASDGAIDITTSGPGGPWTTEWSTGSTTEDLQNLQAGCYTVTVFDATGCGVAQASICVKEPDELAATDSISNISCFGKTDGCIYLNTIGGTAPYDYVWSNGASGQSICNLAVGNYDVTITDSHHCSTVLQNISITEPSPLAVSTAETPVTCKGFDDGTITVTASGGTPNYHYSWNPTNADNNLISALASGMYDLTVTDARGCTISKQDIFIDELPGIELLPLVQNVPCPELKTGAVYMAQTGAVPPVHYAWSNGSATEDITALPIGIYSVTVTDSRNCKVDTTVEIISEGIFQIYASPEDTFIPLGGKVKIEVTHSSGTEVANYTYRPEHYLSCANCSITIASPMESMPYIISARDTNGCTASTEVNIRVVPEYPVFVPNAFSPGGNDDRNAFFEVFGNKEAWKQMHIQIFSRWGEKVYDTYDKNFKWDGMYKGKYLSGGVYVYSLKITWIDNFSRNDIKGSITLLR